MIYTPDSAAWKLHASSDHIRDGDTQVYMVGAHIALPDETVIVERLFIVRLLEIDTPERGQPGWAEATAYSRNFLYEDGDLAMPRPVDLRLTDKHDVYGRWLGWAIVDGVNLSYALHDSGHGEYRPATVHAARLMTEG